MDGTRMWRMSVLAGILAGAALVAHAAPESIFVNARVFTADDARPAAQAFAVENGRILAIGEQEEVLAYRGPQTQVVDLQDRRVLPGLIDAHMHAVIGGLAALSPNLEDAELDTAELARRVQGWRAEAYGGAGDPLVVFGVNPGAWAEPQRLAALFDTAAWDAQPLLLLGSDLHTAWANRAMRERSGITRAYVDSLALTQRHTVGAGSDGEPDGILVDAGVDLATLHLPKPDAGRLLAAARFAVQANNRYGITAWMDPAANAGPGEALFSRAPGSMGTGVLPAYRALAEAGELSAHVAALLVASPRSDAEDLDRLGQVRDQFLGVPNLSLPGIKIFADGVLEYPAQSAAVLEPYRNSGLYGEMLLTREGLRTLVDAADARGWLVHIHALGDRAVRESLDAFDAARARRDSGVAHSITHLQLVDPADRPRFARLGVIAVMQLHWAEMDNYLLDLVKPYLNEQAFMAQYPARSLQKQGAVIAGASDWPISTANPWEAMHHAMTRQGQGGGLNPAERLDATSMLLAYTRHAAQAIGLADRIGTLQPGKQADFIVVDRDVLEADAEALGQTQVLATYFGGRQVYAAP